LERVKPVADILATVLVIVLTIVTLVQVATERSRPLVAAASAPRRERPQAPLPAEPLTLEGAAQVGKRDAKVALIEFSDFQCPFCARFAIDTLPELRKRYIDAGLIVFAYRHLPLSIHPLAAKAAEAAECAGSQGRFWAMHNQLFATPNTLTEAAFQQIAIKIGLDPDRFDTCLKSETAAKISADAELARVLQVSGTPTFFVGTIEQDRRVRVKQRLSGAQPIAAIAEVLDKHLAESAPSAAIPRR
jgi:protein-disulfide isomerase